MKHINLIQRSEEWLNYRKTRIGATDFNQYMQYIMLSKSHYKQPWDKVAAEDRETSYRDSILTDKLSGKKDVTSAMQYGVDHEQRLSVFASICYGKIFTPTIIESEQSSYIFASLDGLDDDLVLEIKTTGLPYCKENALLNSYKYQFAHQMYVTSTNEMCLLIEYGRTEWNTRCYSIHNNDGVFTIYNEKGLLLSFYLTLENWLRYCYEYLDHLNIVLLTDILNF